MAVQSGSEPHPNASEKPAAAGLLAPSHNLSLALALTKSCQSGSDLGDMAVLASAQEPRTPNFSSHVNKGRRSRRHSASLPGDVSINRPRPMRQHTSDLMMMARDGRAHARDSRALVRDSGGRPSRK